MVEFYTTVLITRTRPVVQPTPDAAEPGPHRSLARRPEWTSACRNSDKVPDANDSAGVKTMDRTSEKRIGPAAPWSCKRASTPEFAGQPVSRQPSYPPSMRSPHQRLLGVGSSSPARGRVRPLRPSQGRNIQP